VEILLNDERRFTASLGGRTGEQIIPLAGYTKPVSKLRVTIEDVYPGTDFDDTCSTRAILYDVLPGDPGVRHAR